MNPLLSFLLALFLALPAMAEAPKKASPTLVVGQDNAPVVIDDYSSLGCGHCANFHLNTLPRIKQELIATGRVKLVYHHFPLDKASVDAALLVHCVKPADAWTAMDLLFREQANWARDPKYRDKLMGYGQMLGLTPTTVRACLNDTALRNRILEGRQAATKNLNIKATPTLIFNKGAARLEGDQTFDQVMAVVGRL